ncbi:MAG: acyl transferase [Chitinophagaceae bacterium]|nr:acyl transferase [Chitinophagaceae bacterium]
MICEFEHNIFSFDLDDFDSLALRIFEFQYRNNSLYRQFTDAIYTDISDIKLVTQIPFLPIQFFKGHEVKTGEFNPQTVFESSGTSQTINSRHLVRQLNIYQQSFSTGFRLFYGDVKEYCILALLPAYLERQHSSLVMMVDELIRKSAHPDSGFYLYDHDKLFDTLQRLEAAGQKTILIGVTFALLDFAEKYSLPLKHTIIMETGGMKGRREELVREQVHQLLTVSFGVESIHSEYGMTELLSQAYSKGNGLFQSPPWLKIVLRDEDDPLTVSLQSRRGLINVIDFANIYSCSFIATDDVGQLHSNGDFEVLGRLDNSDIRGCSLLLSAD